MMRKQVKKLDKNHLEMIHLDTCVTALFTNHLKTPD